MAEIKLAALAATLTLALALHAGPAAAAEAPPPLGHVILARTGGDALLIWDASPDIASIVAEKSPDAAADARLQHDGLRILASSLGKLDKSAKTVTLRIVYNKTGAVSPVYSAATLADVERYATLTVPVEDLRGDRGKWREAGAAKPLPPWAVYKVTGQLPPR